MRLCYHNNDIFANFGNLFRFELVNFMVVHIAYTIENYLLSEYSLFVKKNEQQIN